MITHADLSRELNLATHFVDRNVEEGRGDRTALLGPDGPTSYSRLAELVNRSGNVLLELGVRPEERVLLVLGDLAGQLERIVLVNSHFEPEQVETLRRTGLPLLELTRRVNAERLTEEFRIGSCHAGRYETSLVLADRPDLVHADRMSALEAKIVDMPGAIAEGRNDFLAMGMDEAYCGSPAEASAEEGGQTFEILADMLVELVREVARR